MEKIKKIEEEDEKRREKAMDYYLTVIIFNK